MPVQVQATGPGLCIFTTLVTLGNGDTGARNDSTGGATFWFRADVAVIGNGLLSQPTPLGLLVGKLTANGRGWYIPPATTYTNPYSDGPFREWMTHMQLETLQYEKRGHVAYVTLDRPEKLNAMNETMHRELGEVWDDFRDDPGLRAAILSGNGRCFSAGADLSFGAPTETYQYRGEFADITRTRRLYKPIIAALHSHVVGYGMWIAMDADFCIAAPDTSFWLPEPQWGIATIPAAWFPKMMPWAIASELLLAADRIDAERAYQVGIVNKVVPRDELMQAAETLAARLCSLSPAAVQGMKESMVRASNLDYTALDQITDIVQTRVMNLDDRREGGRAFVEKREANWD